MNGTQDQQTALLREELAKLLSTLNHNREKVSLDVLKTKYKKGYDTLCAGIRRSASGLRKADSALRHPYPQGFSG